MSKIDEKALATVQRQWPDQMITVLAIITEYEAAKAKEQPDELLCQEFLKRFYSWLEMHPHEAGREALGLIRSYPRLSEREIVDVKPGTLPINIDDALEALHTQYQFCGDAIIARRSPDAPTDTQLGRIRAAHLNIIPILKALKAALSKIKEGKCES